MEKCLFKNINNSTVSTKFYISTENFINKKTQLRQTQPAACLPNNDDKGRADFITANEKKWAGNRNNPAEEPRSFTADNRLSRFNISSFLAKPPAHAHATMMGRHVDVVISGSYYFFLNT